MGKVRNGVIKDIDDLLEKVINSGYQYNEYIMDENYSDNELSLVRKFLYDISTT